MRFPEIVYQKSCGSQFREGFPEEVMLKELGEKHEGLKGGRNLPGRQSISSVHGWAVWEGECQYPRSEGKPVHRRWKLIVMGEDRGGR